MLQMGYFCSVSIGEEKLAILPKYICAGTNSLFSVCTQHGRRLISHSNISVGNEKMAEMHAEATPFSPGYRKRNIGTVDRENVTFSAL